MHERLTWTSCCYDKQRHVKKYCYTDVANHTRCVEHLEMIVLWPQTSMHRGSRHTHFRHLQKVQSTTGLEWAYRGPWRGAELVVVIVLAATGVCFIPFSACCVRTCGFFFVLFYVFVFCCLLVIEHIILPGVCICFTSYKQNWGIFHSHVKAVLTYVLNFTEAILTPMFKS